MGRPSQASLRCMVVVPFYADVPLLRTALDSLLAQTDAN
jgi:hypothetical protein